MSQFQQFELLDGDLVLYKRSNDTKGRWSCRFVSPLASNSYIRKSLKTAQRGVATERALDLYREYQARKHFGLSSGSVTIEDIYNRYIHLVSLSNRANVTRIYNKYWLPFLSDTDLSKAPPDIITNLISYRIRHRHAGPTRGFIASTDTISQSTLQKELAYLRLLLTNAHKHQLLKAVPHFPKISSTVGEFASQVHSIQGPQRRGRFSKEEYRKLSAHLATIRKALNDETCWPRTIGREAWNPETNPLVSFCAYRRATKDYSKHKGQRPRWVTAPMARFSRATIYFIARLIAETGIRPLEAFRLRHKDIQLIKDRDNELYTVVDIRGAVSKVKKPRTALATDRWETYSRYQEYCREVRFAHNCNPQPEDYLFPGYKDVTVRRPKAGFTANFQSMLKALDLHYSHPDEQSEITTFHSLYSLRSFYISERLRNNVDIYLVSKQVGASVATIERYYDDSHTFSFRDTMTNYVRTGPDAWEPTQAAKAKLPELVQYAQEWKR